MNKKQRTAIIIGIVLIILTGIFAPFSMLGNGSGVLVEHRYGAIFSCSAQDMPAKLDTAQLYAEWVFILLVIGGFVLLNTDRRE